MTQDQYARLKDTLKAVAQKQRKVTHNILSAEKRFRHTEEAIASLLDAIKKRKDRN